MPNYKEVELSIVIPALNESENLSHLLPEINEVLMDIPITHEVIVVDELADDHVKNVVRENGAILISPDSRGYGSSIMEGIRSTRGKYIITMDADFSHPPLFIRDLWGNRNKADVIIASRYIKGGKAMMPLTRYVLSRILNLFFSRGLDLNVKDMSSGFRFYRSEVVVHQSAQSINFDICQELLVGALIEGYKILEIPFSYNPRKFGSSHSRVLKFGIDYLKTFAKLWKVRNSIASADYDARAYNTLLLPQRFWQRQRFKYVTGFIKDKKKCLDVGCGTSKILGALPAESIALDILIRKLRYARIYNKPLLQASALSLPIQSDSFDCVICSQVIEHIPRSTVLDELDRVLKPGGRLILGTPDYGRWQWIAIEWFTSIYFPRRMPMNILPITHWMNC
jgi:dolichol-phosphate mannosyltransferase